tara:strand:- start:118 stop:324 length:207 start_codon:yes stop_codon:yes gene_type:complete
MFIEEEGMMMKTNEWFHDKNNQERLAYLNMVADDQDKAGLTCTAEDYRLTVQWIEGLLRELNEGVRND